MKINKAIITSGPTKEWIDPVRFITNASSGKMGYVIAKNIQTWISEIIYIHGSVCDEYANISGAKNIAVDTTEEMKDQVIREIANNTLVIMAAAPADFKPKEIAEQKIKKEKTSIQSIDLVKNPDILISLSEVVKALNLNNVIRIGFAAETHDLAKHAMDKLIRKELELVIANHVYKSDRGFGNIDSEISVFSRMGLQQAFTGDKDKIGKNLSNFLKDYLNEKFSNI